jgi:hypothetical protein
MLPPQWRCLEGLVNCAQRESETTWTSSCPVCGGERHPNGDPSDRFVMFCDDHPAGYCRRCQQTVYPDQFGNGAYQRPSPEELELARQRERQRQEKIKATAEQALRMLEDDQLWLRFYEDLRDDGRRYWQHRGVPKPFQDLWSLGMRRGWRLPGTDRNWHEVDAASIPLRDERAKVLNIKYRLVNPPNTIPGRYRYHIKDSGAPPFICNVYEPIGENVILVEGEIKAMVVFATLDDADACVVGMPGLHPGEQLLGLVKDAQRITLVTDPGSRVETWKLVKGLGKKRCRVLIPPLKVDDALIASRMNRHELGYLLRNAVPCE